MKLNTSVADLGICAGTPAQFPRDGKMQIALSGRSNVGKSSLINTLLGRKSLARVSGAPGKTVTVNFYEVGGKIYLVDLPGYGYARRSRDKQAIFSSLTNDYYTQNPLPCQPALTLQLIDIRTGPTDDDIMMINYLIDSSLPFRVIATKTDKLSKTALAARLEELHRLFFDGTDITLLPFSAVTGAGKEEIWRLILDAAEGKYSL